MGNERVSKFVIEFDATEGSISQVLSSIKSSVRNATADIEKTSNKVKLFEGLEQKTKASAEAMFDASAKAKILAAELDKIAAAGGKATPELVKGLQAANKEVTTATNAYNRNVDALTKLQNQLKRADVDTSNLARAQLKLAEASKAAAAAAEQQAAKQLLGLKTFQDLQPQIQKLNGAFEALRTSGTLSAKEIAIAHSALQARIKETNAQVTTLGGGFKTAGTELSSFAAGAATRFLGIAAVFGTVTAAVTAGIDASKAYRQGLAEIGTVTNLTREQLDQLGAGARELATTIGFDLQAGLKALFDLIRSGVPADNALEVLRVSAEAAKAGLSDIGTTARISTLLLDGFGLEVSDLGGAFDKLIQGGRDGGATFKEFADSAGPLLNVARAAKVPFDELVATFTVMTDASNDASGSAAALTKIIVKLGDPETRGKLKSLGIESTNLVEIFRQLGEKGIPLQQFIDLGLASTKTAAGVAALTNNTGKLAPELDKVAAAAGKVAEVNKGLYDSPKERSDRFNAALHETSLQFGLLLGSGSKLAAVGTSVLTRFNELSGSFQRGGIVAAILNASLFGTAARLLGIVPASNAATVATDDHAAAMKRASAEADATTAKFNEAKAALTGFGAALLASVQALQAAGSRDIADIQARADAQIAALDRSVQATAATAAATIAIQNKAAAERLAAIQKNEADVNAVIETAVAARRKVLEDNLKGDKDRETKIAAEIAQIRLGGLAKTLKDYQDFQASQVALQAQHIGNINNLEQQRVAFNRGIEDQLFQIRLAALSVFDQYVAKVNEVERLTALARKQGADGFIEQATQTANKAIALALSLGKVVNENSATIVGKYEAQGAALKAVNTIQADLNANIDAQKGKEQDAANALGDRVKDVSLKIADLQLQYSEFKNDVGKGLALTIKTDETSVNAARATIDDLTRDRVVNLIIKTTREDGSSTPGTPLVDQIPRGLNRGGLVGQLAQRFASGGSVFRRPNWNKVPGSGSGDTVPAGLQSGSYVLRKAASLFYGDALLSRLARGYAGGGFIGIGGVRWNMAEVDKGVDHSRINSPTTAAMIDPIRGFQSGDSFQTNDPGIQFTPAPIPQALITAMNVIAYAREMLHMVGETHPLLGNLGTSIKQHLQALDRDPTDVGSLNSLLQEAQTIGANPYLFSMWGKTQSATGKFTPIWFIDWLKNNRAGDFQRAAKQFAVGGSIGRDIIPAWLTPGEHVMQPAAVAKYGTNFMHALNNMQVPRGFLGNVLDFPAPRPNLPRIARFAEGGSVGGVTRSGGRGGPDSGGVVNNFHFHMDASDLLSEDQVRRKVIPVIDKATKRGR